MAEETGKNFKGPTKKKKEDILLWIHLLIGFVASVIVGSMGYIFYLGNHMVAIHIPMCAAMEIRIEITTAHLWFEEIISGDQGESIDTVWGHLDEADWYAQAILVGGENPHWKYRPVDDAGICREVENIQVKLAEFRTITEERFAKPADSPAGSEIDRKYDAVFAELVNGAGQVEVEIKQMIGRKLRRFHIVQTILIFICVLITVLAGIVISRFMRRQIRDELKLQATNQQLDASNQQLLAGQEQLKASNQQLDDRNRALQDFAYIASHDLQEPLRKVLAFGDRLKDSCSDTLNEKETDYLERMQNAARRMKDLINDLLTYSRTTTNAKSFEEVDLKRITNEVLSDLEVTIEEMGAEVEIGQLPILQADPSQMMQLMQNLISNALKFHKPDEAPVVKITSEISIHQSDSAETNAAEAEFCRVIVEDNGIGFEQKYADKIFKMFQRLHGRSEYEGTGVGLAVCQKIVQRHDGTITTESSPGKGSRFIITFPINRVKSEMLQTV